MYSWLASGRKKGEGASFGQSPSAPPEVRGRLNFSALDSPRPPSRLSVDRTVSLSPASGRLGEYHRSKQNPDVLDQYLSPQTTSRLPKSLYKSSLVPQNMNSQRFNMFSSSPPLITGSPLSSSRRALTQLRSSVLSTRKPIEQRASPFSTSLVSMAVRSRLHQTQSLVPGVSPVIVHLTNTHTTTASSSTATRNSEGEIPLDPCDKDVVISALKQKRKRWACHGDDITSSTESQPAAKRSRHATYQEGSRSLPSSPAFTRPSLHSRKRGLPPQITSSSSSSSSSSSLPQSLKKPRVVRPHSPSLLQQLRQPSTQQASSPLDEMVSVEEKPESEVERVKHQVTMPETGQPREQHVPARQGSGSGTGFGRSSLKLSVPDSEYDSDSESVRCAVGVGGVKGDGVEESSVDSGRGSRGSTPPVHEEEEEDRREEERVRRNKAELQRLHKSLTAVFPSLHKTTSRRKVPVFCATGSVPLQPPVLSTTRSVTQEDWRRERESARAKLRSYLAADDESQSQPPSVVTSTSTSLQVTASPLTTTLSTTAPLTTALATTAPLTTTCATAAPLTTALATTAPLTTAPATTAPLTTALATTAPLTTTLATLPVTTAQTNVTNNSGNSGASTAKAQLVSKTVTFQLPNIVTSSQSMTSAVTSTSQTASVEQSSTGTGTGLVLGSGLKLGSKLASSPSTTASAAVPPLSLPPPTSVTSATSASGGFSLSSTFPASTLTLSSTTMQQQQLPAQLSQQLNQQLPAQLSQQLNQQLEPTPQIFSVSAGLPSGGLLTTATNSGTSQPSLIPSTTISSLSSASPFANTVALPVSSSLSSLQLPVVSNSGSTSQLTLPSLTFPTVGGSGAGNIVPPAVPMSGGLRLGLGGEQTSLSSRSTSSGFSLLSQTSSSGQRSAVQLPAPSVPLQNVTSGGIFKLEATPTAVTSTSAAPAPTFNFGAGGSGGAGGFKFSMGQPTQLPQQKPMFGGGLQQMQNPGGLNLGAPGGIFGAPSTTTANSAAAPSFNFSSLPSTATGGSQPPQKLPGGIFGNTSLQPPSQNKPGNPPTFNFGSSAALPQPPQQQQQQLTTTPMFNFSAAPKATASSALSAGSSLQFGGGGGGGGAARGGGGMFNFSASGGQAGQTGGTLGTAGSSTGLKFGTNPPAQGTSGVGFKFGTNPPAQGTGNVGLKFGTNPPAQGTGNVGLKFGANPPAQGTGNVGLKFGANPPAQGTGNVGYNFSAGASTAGGLSFGSATATPGNQAPAAPPPSGMFGAQQTQVGRIFGQTNNSSGTGGGNGTLFNPSLTTPSNPTAPSPFGGGFNFTPQPTASGFNFAGTPAGGFGSPAGTVGGTFFSAGTPSSDPSRPVATARRRRGRKK